MKTYDNMTNDEKVQTIKSLYTDQNKSFIDIANMLDTYPNKVRRDAIKNGIHIRSKSEAQKNALSTGKHTHPTKGKKRDTETKYKIGRGVLKSWSDLSEEELNKRKEIAKTNWNNLSEDERQQMHNKAINAIRQASKTGSKLEKFLLELLIADNYRVVFHQEQTLVNTKLQIDMVIPELNLAIEVDGPSHFLPVWGNDTLQKNKKYDEKKDGLIVGKGYNLIRIQQTMDFSNSRSIIIYDKIQKIMLNIKQNNLKGQRYNVDDQ